MQTRKNLDVLIVAPHFSPGAPGHWYQYAASMKDAFIRSGNECRIAGPSGIRPRVGHAMVDKTYPILAVGLLIHLLIRKLSRPRTRLLLHSVDCRTAVIPFFLALRQLGLAQRLSLTIIESPNDIRAALQNKLTRVLLLENQAIIQVYGASQQKAFSECGFDVRIAEEICTIKEVEHRTTESPIHGNQLIVVRGSRLFNDLLKVEDRLCEKCTYFIHPPAELTEFDFQENLVLAPRNLGESEYKNFIENHTSHLYLYDPELFELPSGRLLDSLQLKIPCAVPAGSDLANQVAVFGGGYIFEDNERGIIQALNHPEILPLRKKVRGIGEYVSAQLDFSESAEARLRASIDLRLIYFVGSRYIRWLLHRLRSRLVRA